MNMMLKYRIVLIVPAIVLLVAPFISCGGESAPIESVSVLDEETDSEVPDTPVDEEADESSSIPVTEEREPELPIIPHTEVRITRNVEYGRADGIPLLLDIYMPKTPIVEPMPVIVFIHGGGWQNGDKYPGKAEILAKRGFLGISINYRLSGVAPFPAAVEDCKCAIRWVRAHAEEYDIDPDKIGIWGSSAGGHLVMMLGCVDETAGLEGNSGWAAHSSRVQAVCSYFGPADFTIMGRFGTRTEFSAEAKFLGGTMEEIPDVYVKASPITYVSTDDPPLLMVHGNMDYTVSFKQSEHMLDAYQQEGLEATLIEVKDAGHGFRKVTDNPVVPSIEEIEQAVLDFFVKHLIMAD
ncbi:alpha/beta hydrolase fold domain-containing protein [Chloroflexota bacterium]